MWTEPWSKLSPQMVQQEERLAKREQQEAEEHQAAFCRVEELRGEEQHLHRRVTVSEDQPERRAPRPAGGAAFSVASCFLSHVCLNRSWRSNRRRC